MENIFHLNHGVIVALDMFELDGVMRTIDVCESLDGVVGYKIGQAPMLIKGLPYIVGKAREHTEKPLIYDHQKFIPEKPADGVIFAKYMKKAGVDGGITYPFPSLKAERVLIRAFFKRGLNPFILGRMTHNECIIEKDGGIFRNDLPEMIYRTAAADGVEYYIMPGNRPEETVRFVDVVGENIPDGKTPKICMPGFGKQGGIIKKAFKVSLGLPTYVIIGPADCFELKNDQNMREDIKSYCEEALDFE